MLIRGIHTNQRKNNAMIGKSAASLFEQYGTKGAAEVDAFYGFEPWDVAPRDPELIEYARKWGVELSKEAQGFQTAYMFCDSFLAIQQGGNQIGKSYPSLARIVMEMTGEIPFSMRHPVGHDTGIKRAITQLNIHRWGRRDKATGKVIDFNDKTANDGSWDCGNIIGVGVYPRSLIPPTGSKTWLCTFKQAAAEMWWPDLQKFVPLHLLDTKRGTNGFSQGDKKIYFIGGETSLITYEQGYERTEAKKVHRIYLDEEPPDRRFYLGCVEHAFHLSMMFTPIRGLSWSYHDIYLPAIRGDNPDISLYHATQFDCPWRDHHQIKRKIALLKPWEVEARVFGHYSEQQGKPYFDREKINRWIKRWVPTGKLGYIEPTIPWDSMSDLMKCNVEFIPATIDQHEEEMDTWEIYEEPQANVAYWCGVDTAKGYVDEVGTDYVQDRNVCYFFRHPSEALGDTPDKQDPIIVAAQRTKQKTIPFARNVAIACKYYNNALMGAETKGETGKVFMATNYEYPFWFKCTVIHQQSRKSIANIGFDTSAGRRQQAFDLVGDYIDRRTGTSSDMPHHHLMVELAACVVGKRGQADHTSQGTLDCGMAFAIGLWINEYSRTQIRDNSLYNKLDKRKQICENGKSRPMTYEEPVKYIRALGSRKNFHASRKSIRS